MSRIGYSVIDVPAGVTVEQEGDTVTVKGPNGELSHTLSTGIMIKIDGNSITVDRIDDSKQSRSLHGLNRSLVANMVTGVVQGFSRELEIQGVGFRAEVRGDKLSMALGYSVPVVLDIPDTLTVTVDGGTAVVVKGCNKQMVGALAARIRAANPAEPYKGKGVRYKGEYIRRKVGKTVA